MLGVHVTKGKKCWGSRQLITYCFSLSLELFIIVLFFDTSRLWWKRSLKIYNKKTWQWQKRFKTADTRQHLAIGSWRAQSPDGRVGETPQPIRLGQPGGSWWITKQMRDDKKIHSPRREKAVWRFARLWQTFHLGLGLDTQSQPKK